MSHQYIWTWKWYHLSGSVDQSTSIGTRNNTQDPMIKEIPLIWKFVTYLVQSCQCGRNLPQQNHLNKGHDNCFDNVIESNHRVRQKEMSGCLNNGLNTLRIGDNCICLWFVIMSKNSTVRPCVTTKHSRTYSREICWPKRVCFRLRLFIL